MIPSETDVLVIGGGPAGATVASILSRQGIHTTVLERDAFPRYHIGESLIASLLPMLDLIGAGTKVRTHGFVRKPGAYFRWGSETWSFVFGELKGCPTHSYQVIRSEFDELLLNNAIESGAFVRQEVKVDRVDFEGERAIAAEYHDRRSDVRGSVRFRYLIDCSGRSGVMANQYLRSRRYHHVFKNVALWSYWKGAKIDGYGLPGSARLFSLPCGWIWFIPLHDNTISVGLVLSRDQLKAEVSERPIESIYDEIIQQHPDASAILDEATHGDVHMESDYSYTSDRFSGAGYLICGDAACFLDPLLSSGVHLAMVSALTAAASITAVIQGNISEERAVNFFEASYRRAYLRYLVLVSSFYDLNRGQAGYFWEAQCLTGKDYEEADLKKAFISVASGSADFDDLRDGNYSRKVMHKFAERLREEVGILQADFDARDSKVQQNVSFFDAVKGLYVLKQADAIDGLYVVTNPAVTLADVPSSTVPQAVHAVGAVS
jgi:flavin-dependent dehydrogenase